MLIAVLSLTKVAPELFSLAIAEIVKETFCSCRDVDFRSCDFSGLSTTGC